MSLQVGVLLDEKWICSRRRWLASRGGAGGVTTAAFVRHVVVVFFVAAAAFRPFFVDGVSIAGAVNELLLKKKKK